MYMYGSLSNRLDVIIRDGNKMALLVIDEHDDAVLPKNSNQVTLLGLFFRSLLQLLRTNNAYLCLCNEWKYPCGVSNNALTCMGHFAYS